MRDRNMEPKALREDATEAETAEPAASEADPLTERAAEPSMERLLADWASEAAVLSLSVSPYVWDQDTTVSALWKRRSAQVQRWMTLGLLGPIDLASAGAQILYREGGRDGLWQAHLLAGHAGNGGLPAARWLAAASIDRWMMIQGWPQRYGTQVVPVEGGWRIWTASPGIGDEQRAEWSVPPLSALERAALEVAPPDAALLLSPPAWMKPAPPVHRR